MFFIFAVVQSIMEIQWYLFCFTMDIKNGFSFKQ